MGEQPHTIKLKIKWRFDFGCRIINIFYKTVTMSVGRKFLKCYINFKYNKKENIIMQNMDRMKGIFIDQIKGMTVEQHIELNNILCERYDFNPNLFDKSVIFTCEDCRKLYGKCTGSEETEECDKRFIKYMEGEVDDKNN